MQIRKFNFVLGGVVVLAVVFSSCLKSVEQQPAEKKAYISLMHMAINAPAVEVYVSGTKSSQPIVPGSYSSAYSAVTPGTFDIAFRKANSDSLVAAVGTASYDSLKYYTLLVYNDQPTSAKVMRIADDFSDLGTGPQCIYRFFHLAADMPAVDLYLDNVKVMSNREYADNATQTLFNEFSAQNAGNKVIQVKKAGTDSVITSTNAIFYQNNAFTVFLNGLANKNGVNSLKVDVLQASNY